MGEGMSELIRHAERELKFLTDSDDEMDRAMAQGVLRLIREFADEGHSGMSAPAAISTFERLARFEPLRPLTGEDDEWVTVDDDGLRQNRRCSHVFKTPSGAYDLNGFIFVRPDGTRFTNRDSRVSVTFPYKPKNSALVLLHEDEEASDGLLRLGLRQPTVTEVTPASVPSDGRPSIPLIADTSRDRVERDMVRFFSAALAVISNDSELEFAVPMRELLVDKHHIEITNSSMGDYVAVRWRRG